MISPEWLRIALLAALVNIHQHWRRLINTIVPDPYLDEVFHIPQAQAYWAGKWSHWDDKITTPPALYWFSYFFNVIRYFGGGVGDEHSTVEDLRFVNVFLLYILLVALYLWTGVTRKPVDAENVLQREFNIVMFPLFFFFSGLYYTDLFSALTVVLTYVAWAAAARWTNRKWLFQPLQLVLGLLSLASRQTNIFWVGVFLGGLQVVHTVKQRTGAQDIHDPEVGLVWFEDVFTTCISLVNAAIPQLLHIIRDVWPQLALLVSFAGFVVWNGGVVLGDKTNHIATIHLPQLLYIWPFIIFFSWPVLLPQLTDLQRLKSKLPRAWTAITVMSFMLLAVHFNTIVHPFTLADNRHYVFYIFRILMRKWWIKYAVVPIYYISAWLVLNALGTQLSNTNRISKAKVLNKTSKDRNTKQDEKVLVDDGAENGNVNLSFALIWFVSTALSLVTAPLVEPRYFILPWLIWRLHVPERVIDGSKQEKGTRSSESLLSRTLRAVADYSLWIELVWYLAVNYATCWMFLYRGFSWIQEPGQIQRFMW